MTAAAPQVVLASTLFGAATVAAAMDAGLLGTADRRRVLVVSNNAAVPETTIPLHRAPGAGPVCDRFDEVVDCNEVLRPHHPSSWAPRAGEAHVIGRLLGRLWQLGDGAVELVVESLQVRPARTLTALFPDAPVTVYADGLLSYGPTRTALPPVLGQRVRALLHLDLVPGLRPLLLREHGVPTSVIPWSDFAAVLDQVAAAAPSPPPVAPGAALLIGQYLAALGVLTPQEEDDLHLDMLRAAARRGAREVVFKAHPSAPVRYVLPLHEEASRLGVALHVEHGAGLAEVLVRQLRPPVVLGCFSTALFTSRLLYDVPVARVGTELVLQRLTPYQNSNRIAVTLADVLLPDAREAAAAVPLGAEQVGARIQPLVDTVGYCMQPRLHPDLRPTAVQYLLARTTRPGGPLVPGTGRFIRRRRLEALSLPGVPFHRRRLKRLRPLARRARTALLRLPGARQPSQLDAPS